MIPRIPIRILSIRSVSRPISRSAARYIHHIKSRPQPLPLLSPKNQQKRLNSTTPPPPPPPEIKPLDLRSQLSNASPTPTPAPLSPTTPPKPKRSLKIYIYATTFLLLGLATGQYIRLILAPPPLPPAGSPIDQKMIEYIHSQASTLPIVKSLSADPNWTHHDAYTSLTTPERTHRLTTGPLSGARAIGGYQRIFTNTLTSETVSVIWFGGAIAGWPGVTHGGVIATVMDESLGRCAVRSLRGNSGVTANLELDYLKPVVTNCFYVVRTERMVGREGGERKAWISGRLETVEGVVCVEAKALFVVPKGYVTKAIGGKY